MSRGWYPRRRGILEHLNNGRISLLDAAVRDFLCLICNYRTGVAFASAEKIRALCPRGTCLRAVQRSLAWLEKIGWIKRFRRPGARGNYPILIGKYFVIDASLTWYSVNLEKTTDWRDVQFDVVTDEVFTRHSAVPERSTGLSPLKELKEIRNEKGKKETVDRPSEETGGVAPQKFRENSPLRAKRIAHPILPTWELGPDMRLFAADHGIPDPESEFEKFKDFHLARGKTFKDWNAAWRTWVRNYKKFDRRSNGEGSNQQPQSFAERNITRARAEFGELRTRIDDVLRQVGDGVSEPSDGNRLPESVPRGLERPRRFPN